MRFSPVLKIAKLLQKSDIKDGIPIIAFIDDWAISAGAMLAYSCRFISVIPGAIMGAAEPILIGKDGKMEAASEKVNSALRAEFASLANFYGRNPLIAEAMVDKDKVLVVRNHNIVELRSNEEIIHSGSDPDTVITEKGKLLTLKSDEMIKLGVADFELPSINSFSIEDVRNPAPKWPGKNSLVFYAALLSKDSQCICDFLRRLAYQVIYHFISSSDLLSFASRTHPWPLHRN